MRQLLLAIGFLFATTLGFAQQVQRLERTGTVLFDAGDANITRWTVELADTDEEQRIGLMNRPSMPAGTGMLFDFGRERQVSMWMRNTLIPLDMVFVCADGTIARVARAEPLDETIVPSGEPVRYVLEVNAGEATGAGLARGKRLDFAGSEKFDTPKTTCGG